MGPNDEQLEAVWSLIERVLASWPAYQLAVANQSAGAKTKERTQMLQDELAQLLLENKNLDEFEVEEWIDDAFDQGFNLSINDGSVLEMSRLLLTASKHILANEMAKAAELVAKLAQPATVQSSLGQSKTIEEDSASGDDEDGEEEAMEQDAAPLKHRQPKTETDEDGWTTILPRQK